MSDCCLLVDALEGMVSGRRGRERRRVQMISELSREPYHIVMKRLAQNKIKWKEAMRSPA